MIDEEEKEVTPEDLPDIDDDLDIDEEEEE